MKDRSRFARYGFVAILLAALAALVWTIIRDANRPADVELRPERVMGTETRLVVVLPQQMKPRGRVALARAEARLRDVEALMSVHIETTKLSLLNAAAAGERIELGPELRGLLVKAGQLAAQTDGGFDATCRPVLNLWRQGKIDGEEPSPEEIDQARKLLGMRHLRIEGDAATKLIDGLQIDLGALAKGYGVDRAFEVIRKQAPAKGALVEVGGDLRCAGQSPRGRPWLVGIRHPFRQGLCGELRLSDAAVATSGDYLRNFKIGQRSYSHILDPRTGRPVANTPSVTVVSLPAGDSGPSCAEADAWATALSVLGPEGFKKLADRPDLEAMIVTGTPTDHQVHMTDGFAALMEPGTKIELD